MGSEPTAPPGRPGARRRRRRTRALVRPLLGALALALAAYLAFHYTAPAPRRELLVVTRAGSTRAHPDGSRLTAAPDLASTTDHRIYGITRAEAALLAHGGRFTCTVTRPVKDQAPDAADCAPAGTPVPGPGRAG